MSTAEIAAPDPSPRRSDADRFTSYRNPIFQRELVALLRSRKAFALLLLYLAVPTAMILASWPRQPESLLLQGVIEPA